MLKFMKNLIKEIDDSPSIIMFFSSSLFLRNFLDFYLTKDIRYAVMGILMLIVFIDGFRNYKKKYGENK